MADPEDLALLAAGDSAGDSASAGAWHKVVYPKRHRKSAKPRSDPDPDRDLPGAAPDVFRSVEQQAEDRRRRAAEARRAALAAEEAAAAAAGARGRAAPGSDEDSEGEDVAPAGDGDAALKKPKQKKVKKPKITVAEAASKIDGADLVAYLADITLDSYEGQQHIQLMRFADYFASAFSAVGAAQFPWSKILKESPVAKIIDVGPLY